MIRLFCEDRRASVVACARTRARTLAPRGPLRARPPHRHPSTSHGSPISQLACGRWLEVELDAKVAVVAQQVRREQRPRVEQQADPLRHDLPRATSGHLGYISSSRSAARHNLDPKGGQPDRVGRRVVRVDRASLHMQGTGAAGDGPAVGGASEASRKCLGSVSEVSRKCLGSVSEVSLTDGRRHAVDVRGLGRPAREEHGEVERARRHHQVVVPPRLILHLVVRRRLLLRVRVERLLVGRSGVGADDLNGQIRSGQVRHTSTHTHTAVVVQGPG